MSVPHVDVRALFDLTNRTALVTGGSRGLGLETAMALSEAGAAVAIMGRRMSWLTSAAEELRRRGHSCRIIEGDVADAAQATRAVRDTIEALGGLDILVNNAGISWGAPADELPVEKWNEVLATNVTGTFLMAQAAMRVMRKGGGTIINVASVAGVVGTAPEVLDATGYAASKGAVIALTRDLAVKWARHGIRVNAIAPGFFDTRMSTKVIEQGRARIERLTPMARIGRPGELGDVVVFLASDAARYMTGHVLPVDGGMLAW
jgi:NAD(P)-dependent dehydrogenase (short-subunit alcohol dehydrogenase family)